MRRASEQDLCAAIAAVQADPPGLTRAEFWRAVADRLCMSGPAVEHWVGVLGLTDQSRVRQRTLKTCACGRQYHERLYYSRDTHELCVPCQVKRRRRLAEQSALDL